MTLHLTQSQADLVHTALEWHHRDLKKQNDEQAKSVSRLIDPALFQLELLITWFDRQKEMRT